MSYDQYEDIYKDMAATRTIGVDKAGTVDYRPVETAMDKLDPGAALKTLAELGTRRAALPTMAGAQLADLSEVQQTILVQALFNDGSIAKGPHIRTIRALVRKGFMDFNYRDLVGKRREPIGGRLTARGTREALRIQTARKVAEGKLK